MNFKIAYTTALGELRNNEEMLEMMWPIVYSLEHISYLLDRTSVTKGVPKICQELNGLQEVLSQKVIVTEMVPLT